MSRTVDERVVSMQFDNRQFESNVQTTMSTLDRFKQKLNLTGCAKGLTDIDSASKKVDMRGIGTAVEAIQAKFSALQVIGVTALANITNSAVNAGKRIVSALTIDPVKTGMQEYETQIGSIQTILANTKSKGSTLNDVKKSLNELNTYADKTIYNFTEMTRNSGTFTAAGVDLQTSTNAIQGIANLAAISGSTSQQASTAMYQLSQALATGTIRLMDWNSVVNAGMGGQVFQDALKETSRELKTGADAAIKAKGSFRESLQTGWLTSEVLTQTLKKFTTSGANEYVAKYTGLSQQAVKATLKSAEAKYGEADAIKYAADALAKKSGKNAKEIKEILDMAKTAEDAATKVKTFSQLWDTLKEAAQSGWTQTWEIIVGDFTEAQDFLTRISDGVGSVIQKMSDNRNKYLSEGLSSGWKQLLNSGISDEEAYKKTIQEVAKSHKISFSKMIEDEGSFDKALKKGLSSGKINADMLSESVSKLTEKVNKMSYKQREAAGYSEDNVEALNNLNKGLKDGSISMDEFVNKMTKPSGRENFIESLFNSAKALISIAKPIGDAFREIFPTDNLGDKIYGFSVKLRDFTSKLTISKDAAEKLKRSFKGLFSILDIGRKIIFNVGKSIGKLLGSKGVSDLGNFLLDITATIGDFFTSLNNSFDTDGFSGMLSKIVSIASGTLSTLTEGVGGFTNILSAAGGIISNVLGKAWDIFKKVFGWITNNISFSDIMAGVAGGGMYAAAMEIKKTFESITDTLNNFLGKKGNNPGTRISDILTEIHNALQAFTVGIKTTALLAIAVSVTLLVSAIEKLGQLKVEDISQGLLAIGIAFGILLSALRKVNKTIEKFGSKGIIKSSFALILLAEAVKILSKSIAIMGELSWDELIRGLAGVGISLIELSVALKILDKVKVPVKTSIAMIALAKSCGYIADALKKMGTMSWGEIGHGLTAMAGALAEMVLVIAILGKIGKGKSILGATAILIVSKSLDEVSENLKRFGSMSWKEIGRGLAAMGGALLELGVVVGLLGKLAGFSGILGAAAILIAVQSLDELSENLKRFGNMLWEEIGRGLAAMGGALLELGIVLGLLGKLAGFSGILGAVSLVIAVQSLDELSENLKRFGDMQWDEIKRGLTAMGLALLELGLVVGALGKIAGFSGILGSAAILIVVQALDELSENLKRFGSMSWGEIGRGLTAMVAALLVVAGISGVLGTLAGLSGILGGAAIWITAQGLVDLADALKKMGTMSWSEIGRGLTAMIGVMGATGLGGILNSLSGLGAISIDKIAEPLSKLADVLKKYGEMNWNEVKSGLTAMAGAMGATGLGGLLNTFSGLGAMSIATVAEPLGVLADSVKKWANVKVPEGLGKQLGILASGVAKFTFKGLGANALSTAAEPLGVLANSVKKWTGITVPEDLPSKCKSLASAVGKFTFAGIGAGGLSASAEPLGKLAEAVSKWKGVKLTEDYTTGLSNLSAGIKSFTWAFAGGWSIDAVKGPLGKLPDAIKKWKGVEVPENIKDDLKNLSAGIRSFTWAFMGGWSIDAAVEPLGKLSSAVKKWKGVEVPENIKDDLKNLSAGIRSFTWAFIGGSTIDSVASPLGNLARAVSKWKDVKVPKDIASGLKSIASGIRSFWGLPDISDLASSFKKLSSGISTLNKINFTSLADRLKYFVKNVGGLGSAGTVISSFATSVSMGATKVFKAASKLALSVANGTKSKKASMSSAGSGLINSFIKGMNSKKGTATKNISTIISSITKSFKGKSQEAYNAGKTFMSKIISGIESMKTKVSTSARSPIDTALTKIRGYYSKFSRAGKYLGSGLVIGINSKQDAVYRAGYKLGQKAVQGEKDGQKSHSPSKLTIQAGKWLGEGLIIGIKTMGRAVYNASHNLGGSAVNSISSAISRMSSIVENDIDAQPTIRPVLDLSNIASGAGDISDMLSLNPSVGVISNVRSINSMMNRNQNGANDDVVSAIKDLKNSINNMSGDTYSINGITYDDGSNITNAVQSIVRAARQERRI